MEITGKERCIQLTKNVVISNRYSVIKNNMFIFFLKKESCLRYRPTGCRRGSPLPQIVAGFTFHICIHIEKLQMAIEPFLDQYAICWLEEVGTLLSLQLFGTLHCIGSDVINTIIHLYCSIHCLTFMNSVIVKKRFFFFPSSLLVCDELCRMFTFYFFVKQSGALEMHVTVVFCTFLF